MKIIPIPQSFFSTKYDGSKYPGKFKSLDNGANCQSFAYEILKHFGLKIKGFRSSELWEDKDYSKKVRNLKPLDLVLFSKERKAHGAHVGVYLGANKVIHLSKEVGVPVIWEMSDFNKHSRYKIFIGAKRIIKIPPQQS